MMATNCTGLTYGGQEKTPSLSGADVDFAADAGSPGGLFHLDYKRHDDLRNMLDSAKDNLKLEAMKRIIGMVAKGRDASDLFPAVVKNVVSKNIEVKKLVYVYLVRYAEDQQDLALLSISTFQRALKDPNQLIRASALRVLSSIRVPVIVPIMMLAIRDSVNDMSPYVRKTAAHAIPKLYDLDPEQKDELVLVIEKLLSDQTTLVVGSAVMAFEQVCPERTDLIHKNYRKLCSVLVDIEEWGQVVIISMLTRYARTQFTDPNANGSVPLDKNKAFYEDSDVDEETAGAAKLESSTTNLDMDHRLLFRNTKPLLQSRNSSVVMAVAQLYYHLAPKDEVVVVARALIRLLRSRREVQIVVLNTMASMSVNRKDIFDPFLKHFFVRSSDATQIKLLKLEILTNLANESNISSILREFQTYIASQDKDLIAAAIQAIGRCAAGIQEVKDVCLGGLIALLSNNDELIVAESVVVIKKLLQTQQGSHGEIVGQMARLVCRITVPPARAAILWLVGEHCDKKGVSKMAPDVLRLMAKTFANEQDVVKLQILNLATKMVLSEKYSNVGQVKTLSQFVFSLAKYDQNYDIRDRVRFLRHLVFPESDQAKLSKYAKKIFLAPKPAPVIESVYKDRDDFQLGSLSHYINSRAVGYMDLPPFPEVAPDPSVRDVPTSISSVVLAPCISRCKDGVFPADRENKNSFYSETSSEDEEDGDEKLECSDSEQDSLSETDSDSEIESPDSEVSFGKNEYQNKSIDTSQQNIVPLSPAMSPASNHIFQLKKNQSSSETSSEVYSSDYDRTQSDFDSDPGGDSKATNSKTFMPKSNLDLLLDLDVSDSTPVASLLSCSSAPVVSDSLVQLTSASFVLTKPVEIVSGVSSGCNLQVLYRYTRSAHLYSASMVNIELTLVNCSSEDLVDIKIGYKNIPVGLSFHEFSPIPLIPAGSTRLATVGVDFGDSTQNVSFDLMVSGRPVRVSLRPSVGELIRPVCFSEGFFLNEQGKLKGMNELCFIFSHSLGKHNVKHISANLFRAANLGSIVTSNPNVLRFAGQTISSESLVLVTIHIDATSKLVINSGKMVIGSMLLTELKDALQIY